MTEKDFENCLTNLLLDSMTDDDGEGFGVQDVNSFDSMGVMTMNKGLVVSIVDEEGNTSEFQLTIVRSY